MSDVTNLAVAPVGIGFRLGDCLAGESLRRQLSTLGLRPGAHVMIVNKTPGHGAVVAVDGSRVALDHSVLSTMTVRRQGPVQE